jgi:hypothetical protein
MEKSALQEILEELSHSYSFKVREYSGRGMYGRKCLAVTTNIDSVHSLQLGFYIAHVAAEQGLLDETENILSDNDTKEDSMGLGTVIYWPRVPYVKESNEGEGDLND